MNWAPRLSACSRRLRSDVVGLDDRAEPAGRADRLEPRDADPEDEDVGRLGRPRGGRQEREVPAIGVGRDEDRLVATDIRLARQGIHALGPRERPRDRVEADRRHPLSGQARRELRVEQRLEQPDDRLAAAEASDLLRARLLDPQDDVGSGSTGRPSRRPSRPPSRYAASGIRLPSPAPCSTRTSRPADDSLRSSSGTRATRRSPGAVSLATPTFMGTTLSVHGGPRADRGPGPWGYRRKDTRSGPVKRTRRRAATVSAGQALGACSTSRADREPTMRISPGSDPRTSTSCGTVPSSRR